VALALFNDIIIDLHFPRAVYLKLLDRPLGFAELRENFPAVGRSLQALLDYNDDDFDDVFALTFSVEQNALGQTRVFDLKPGGRAIAVTKANRDEYVQLYTTWYLVDSVRKPFEAFRRGFRRVIRTEDLALLGADDLEKLLIGSRDFDLSELQIDYEGFDPQGRRSAKRPKHNSIAWLWNFLNSLSLAEKRAFLFFVTGSDRAPIAGLSALKIVVQNAVHAPPGSLPQASTCYNTLKLPNYPDEETLRTKLMQAIQYGGEGFGLR
jgi:hypothetical protein